MSAPTKTQRDRWRRIAEIGCLICAQPAEIHHCLTGAGGRKNHDKVIGLCYLHHRGKQGIHFMGRKAWARICGTEQELLDKIDLMVATSI